MKIISIHYESPYKNYEGKRSIVCVRIGTQRNNEVEFGPEDTAIVSNLKIDYKGRFVDIVYSDGVVERTSKVHNILFSEFNELD